MKRIGVIGLGKMGMPIAHNLMERGFTVVGYRRQGSPELEAAGGTVAESPAALAAVCDAVISIVPEADDVEEVVLGPRGTIHGGAPGLVHIEMSTIPVPRKAHIRDAVGERGMHLLDCPISGGPGLVIPRRATTFASGDRDVVDSVWAVLDAISGPCVYTGDFGTGTRMKYVANMLVAIHTVATAEALSLAQRSGLDLELVQRSLDDSIAGSAIFRQRGPMMRERAWEPAPGPIATLDPILQQIGECMDDLEVASPLFRAAKALFDDAMEAGRGDLDISSVFETVSGTTSA